MKKNLLLLVAGLSFVAAMAQAGDVRQALVETAGTWEGELYYLDYTSDQRFAIPMRVEAEATPDGASLVRKLTFTDPGNLVHAVSVFSVDRDSGELIEAFFREGAGELMRYSVTLSAVAAPERWKIIYEHEGIDGGRPAEIRHTIVRRGSKMSSRKEVRFLDVEASLFIVRNGTELTLRNVKARRSAAR